MAYYAVHMEDNSVKVIRFDNNKVRVHLKSVQLDEQAVRDVRYESGELVVPFNSDLQFFNIDERTVQSLAVKPTNFASKSDDVEPPKTQIKSYCITPDRKNLITFEELLDKNSHKEFRVQALKFWSRHIVQEDLGNFQVNWLVHNPCIDSEEGLKIEALDNKTILIINGAKIQKWTLADGKRWTVQGQFDYQDLRVIQVTPNIKFRISEGANHAGKVTAILHKGGQLTFWDQDSFILLYTFRLNNPSQKVVFETSFRYLASLSEAGSVEVWKVKGKAESYQWNLNFKSVATILNNPTRENQFIISMNSKDDQEQGLDSILLFQYSRPQNLIMYWKSQLPFLSTIFCEQDVASTSYVLIINKNFEFQKIYLGVTRDDLKSISTKRKISMDNKLKKIETEKDAQRAVDYQFIQSKAPEDANLLTIRNKALGLQEVQIKRLDKVDKILNDGIESQGSSSFLGMGSLSHYFGQFTREMLSKPSQATTLVELQTELTLDQFKNSDSEMKDISEGAKKDGQDIFSLLEKDLSKVFGDILKL